MTIEKLTKSTYKDFRQQAEDLSLGRFEDFNSDEGLIYFERWHWDEDADTSRYLTESYSYTWVGGVLDVDVTSRQYVVRETNYTTVESPIEKRLFAKLLKHFGGSETPSPEETDTKSILKQFDADKMEIMEPLYTAGGEVDGQGDAYKDEVEGPKQLIKALEEGLELGTVQHSLFHKTKTKTFEITKAWVNENEATLEDGTVIPENQPLVITKFHNEAAYNARVEGRLQGLSIGANGTVEVLKSFLDEMATTQEPTRLLSNFIFTHKAAHVAYTSKSNGGAASLKNEPFAIMKSKVILSEEEQGLLDEFGEELTELEKAKLKAPSNEDNKTAPSTSELEAQDAGVDTTTVNKGQEMSEAEKELKARIAELEKAALATQIEKDLGHLGLEDEVLGVAALALAGVSEDQRAAIVKSLDAVQAVSATKIADLEKSLEATPVQEPTPLEKSLSEEQGHAGGEAQEPTEADIIKANRELAKKEIK